MICKRTLVCEGTSNDLVSNSVSEEVAICLDSTNYMCLLHNFTEAFTLINNTLCHYIGTIFCLLAALPKYYQININKLYQLFKVFTFDTQ